MSTTTRPVVGLFFRHLEHGGIARVLTSLARALIEQGVEVDLVIGGGGGPLRGIVPDGANLVALRPTGGLLARCAVALADPGGLPALLRTRWHRNALPPTSQLLVPLVRYLRRRRPAALLAASVYENLDAVRALALASTRTRLVLSEHAALSAHLGGGGGRRFTRVVGQVRRLYPHADRIVAVSRGVAEDLRILAGLPHDLVEVIHNPVWSKELAVRATAPVADPWFAAGAPPVVLGTGRLVEQKDFPTLVRAFALVRQQQRARLVILGGALDATATRDRQAELLGLAARLGVAEDVKVPGAVPDALPYMARSALFVLSSRWEGFGNVLVEALACGTPVVSTDCPSGPAEILADGRFGRLVPVGEPAALAEAILATLASPPDPALLRDRARAFAVDLAATRYRRVLLDGGAGQLAGPDQGHQQAEAQDR